MSVKLMLNCSNEIWNKVKIYKIQHGLATMNDAVVDLIMRGLK